MTGGWVTHADHARWQLQAARELAAILGDFADLPLLAWTVVPADPLLQASHRAGPGRAGAGHARRMAGGPAPGGLPGVAGRRRDDPPARVRAAR